MPDHGWFLCSPRRSLASPRRRLKIANLFFFLRNLRQVPLRKKGHANPHQPECNAELQTSAPTGFVSRQKQSRYSFSETVPVPDANGLNNQKPDTVAPQGPNRTFNESTRYRSHPAVLTPHPRRPLHADIVLVVRGSRWGPLSTASTR